ncbi:MAG: hypothetical protein EHM25_12070 [Nitrosopumilales archaeon]|nr:MAG: hypothetical protein EHM25_12070 [Nitrosopumilales archaeon]
MATTKRMNSKIASAIIEIPKANMPMGNAELGVIGGVLATVAMIEKIKVASTAKATIGIIIAIMLAVRPIFLADSSDILAPAMLC